MGQAKHMLEVAEQMDQGRGVDCSVCCGRVSASDWSRNHHIRKARDEGHEDPICWSCAKAMYGDD
jgi:hypothetical protein